MSDSAAGMYDHIATLLASMGSQPAAVAATLRAEEVRGVRGSALAHPVCRWLVRLVPDLDATLGRDSMHAFRRDEQLGLHGAIVPLPQPVRTFADQFDQGFYPDLDLCPGPAQPTPAAPQPTLATPVMVIPKQQPPAPDAPVQAAPSLPAVDSITDTVQIPAIREEVGATAA